MVVEGRQYLVAVVVNYGCDAEVDAFIGKLFDDRTEASHLVELFGMVHEVKLADDVLNIVAKAVEVGAEILKQTCRIRLTSKRLHCVG